VIPSLLKSAIYGSSSHLLSRFFRRDRGAGSGCKASKPPPGHGSPLPGGQPTGTGTDVGKTTVACAILTAWRERDRRARLGVCKPFSSGCGRDRDGLVSEDAQSLAQAAGCAAGRSVISPVCYAPPVAPAVAAEAEDRRPDWGAVSAALATLDAEYDAVLVEGVGGVRVPLDPAYPRFMLAEFARALAYPVLVVADAGLGTLNHTLLTIEALSRPFAAHQRRVVGAADGREGAGARARGAADEARQRGGRQPRGGCGVGRGLVAGGAGARCVARLAILGRQPAKHLFVDEQRADALADAA